MSMLARLGLLATLLSALMAHPVLAQTEYRFSPINQTNNTTTAAYWNPIVAYVAEKSGVRLNLKIGRTSADTTAYVLAQEVDFAYTNHLFSPDREQLGWRVLARRNLAALHGQIVVPAESPIKELTQLEGKEVGFPGPEAFVAYKVPYAELLSRKINIRVVFGGNMDGAFAQLLSGKVLAVGANSQLVEGYSKREGKQFRVLWSSEPYNELALMVSPRVAEKDAQAVARAFIGMVNDPAGREILASGAKLLGQPPDTHFVAADAADYAAYKRFYRSAPASLR